MTTLYEHLGELRKEAMKAKDTFTSTKLGVILSEAKKKATQKENRDPTDEEVIAIVKAGLEGIAELMQYEKNYTNQTMLMAERDLLTRFMPTQLSETEIKTIIENAALDHIGKIMGLFKKQFAGKYDGTTVKHIAEQFLAKSP